jgi:CheY-like chemotaxis protein
MASPTILIVDDTRLNRELAKDILEMEGYRIYEAENGKEAIEHARRVIPDIILLDIELPDMNGLEVLRVLREDTRTRPIPIVALTAHNSPSDHKNFLAAGCSGCISKPFETKTFARRVAKFLT